MVEEMPVPGKLPERDNAIHENDWNRAVGYCKGIKTEDKCDAQTNVVKQIDADLKCHWSTGSLKSLFIPTARFVSGTHLVSRPATKGCYLWEEKGAGIVPSVEE